MESETFRSRLAKLMRKSRKALRLYNSMGRMHSGEHAELNDVQLREWKEVNSELLKQLAVAVEAPNSRRLAAEVFALRDRFYNEWRMAESDLHVKQRELLGAAENGDYIKSVLLGRDLVTLKARVQASQAAHHELRDVIERSKVAQPAVEEVEEVETKEEVNQDVPMPEASRDEAKVIPLRRRKI